MVGISKYEQLENKFSTFAGYNYSVACNSGTSALTLALASIGIGPGDEVIVPEFTMIACAWAVSYLGATPVFVDCDGMLNIDITKIEGAITSKTKAIMPVHIYGRACDMKNVMAIADAYGLYVVEDRAEIHGYTTEYKGHIACYSLYKNKIVSSQEGGVLTTDDLKIKKRADNLKSMAFGAKHNYFHAEMGFNMRMPDAQAELALKSLNKVEANLKKRKEWESHCNKELDGVVQLLPKRDFVWVYDFVCKDKDNLVNYVKSMGGQIRHFFKPMSMQPMYRRVGYENLNAYKLSLFGAYIPYGEDKTIDLIKEFYAKKRKTTHKATSPSDRDGANRNSDKKST